MADISTLYTTVKNPLTFTHTYGYLSTHGKTLAGGAHFTQVGDLVSAIMPNNISKSVRKVDALARDLENNIIEILSTPAPILEDSVTKGIKALELSGGTLGVVDPSWGAYTDS